MKCRDGSDAGSVTIVADRQADALFYADWLRLAANSQQCLRQLRPGDPELAAALERLSISCDLNFSLAAVRLMSQVVAHSKMVIEFSSYDAESVSMLMAMGFFIRRGATLRMSKPTKLNRSIVRAAIVMLARTQDRGHMLHPGRILMTVVPDEKEILRAHLVE